MVTEAAAAHDSSDGGVHQIGSLTAGHIEGQRHHDGDHDGVHAPVVPVKKAMKAQTAKARASRVTGVIPALGDADDVAGGTQRLGDGVDAVGHRQDQHSADHGLDASVATGSSHGC